MITAASPLTSIVGFSISRIFIFCSFVLGDKEWWREAFLVLLSPPGRPRQKLFCPVVHRALGLLGERDDLAVALVQDTHLFHGTFLLSCLLSLITPWVENLPWISI